MAEGQCRREAKGQTKVAREKTEHVGLVVKTKHVAAWCRKGGDEDLYAIDEDESEDIEETLDSDEEFQAWCLLGESENEQWQEVISRRDKETMKKANQASLLSVESSGTSSSKKSLR